MSSIIDKISDWLHDLLVEGVMSNLTGMINAVNDEVGSIASDVAQTPANFSPAIFNMIKNISETVIIPIAGMILTFIGTYELIPLTEDRRASENTVRSGYIYSQPIFAIPRWLIMGFNRKIKDCFFDPCSRDKDMKPVTDEGFILLSKKL